jgi:putative FmdB family regulatory protein
MATYEYICLACERPFEDRRPMGSSVQTELACPSCRSQRVRRRFSFAASAGPVTGSDPGPASSDGGCGCGHCTCGA